MAMAWGCVGRGEVGAGIGLLSRGTADLHSKPAYPRTLAPSHLHPTPCRFADGKQEWVASDECTADIKAKPVSKVWRTYAHVLCPT
jgi:hypothetical protein